MTARIALPVVIAVLALGAAQSALAADWCVSPDVDCAQQNNVATLQNALSVAANSPGPDRIFLGAAVYTAPTTAGYTYYQTNGQLELIGKGATSTIVTAPSGANGVVLKLFGDTGSVVRDLKVVIPSNSAASTTGLQTNALALRLNVTDGVPNSNFLVGVCLNGGVFEDSVANISWYHPGIGVLIDSGGGTVRDSIADANEAIGSNGGATIERTAIGAKQYGLWAASGTTTIRSSVINTTANTGATGIEVATNNSGDDTKLVVDGVTMQGRANDGKAIFATTLWNPDKNVDVSVDNTLIRGFATRLWVDREGTGSVHIGASYSDYAPGNMGTGGNGGSITESNVSYVGDANFDNSDVPLAGNQLIDAGDPDEPQGLDYKGNPLVTDGNHDGIVRRDIGAYELDGPTSYPAPDPVPAPPADPAPADPPATPSAADTQAPLVAGFRFNHKRFSFKLNEGAKVVVEIRRVHGKRIGRLTRVETAGANKLRVSKRIAKALRHGRYRAVITATDAAGNRSVPHRLRFRVR